MKKQVLICFLLLLAMFLCACSEVQPGSQSQDNAESTEEVGTPLKPSALAVKEANGIDEVAIAFAIDMLKAVQKDSENCMISPLSVLSALGMTVNGADGETLKQVQDVLFGGNTIEAFNDYYKALINRITNPKNGELSLANSTWYRENLEINEDFIKQVAENFKSEINPSDFYDKKTVDLINDWVKDKTNGYIDKMVNDISEDTLLYLINAVYFEQKWLYPFDEKKVKKGQFHTQKGEVNADFLEGMESIYLKDGDVQGFIKPYESGFSFAALLPNEGVSAEEYLSKLTGKKVLDILKNRERKTIIAKLPKFKAEFEASLNDALISLGITDAFDSDKANFSKMANVKGKIYISDVLHKTFITVNEAGTIAAAATKVELNVMEQIENITTLTFDRPFIYMIIDNQTNLPLFIGIMNNPAD